MAILPAGLRATPVILASQTARRNRSEGLVGRQPLDIPHLLTTRNASLKGILKLFGAPEGSASECSAPNRLPPCRTWPKGIRKASLGTTEVQRREPRRCHHCRNIAEGALETFLDLIRGRGNRYFILYHMSYISIAILACIQIIGHTNSSYHLLPHPMSAIARPSRLEPMSRPSRDHRDALLYSPPQQHLGSAALPPSRHAQHRGRPEPRTLQQGAAQGAVGHQLDVLLPAEPRK